ncbi:hypothetical protein OS493_031188 [Desmophyllum pertusum]|uniref:G-protein coupled receptors family 1 profile domain-containing protein n=1 Tax=Desmophyllum pertusum TaxID=174260 RepID=A0A9W9ZLH5_9CNID|nr:hypothetical protein OS493_031188 [Desmophyllum pertusum]
MFLILTALYRNPHLRNTTNIYIAALAITDLLNASIPGTLFASTMVTGRMIYSMPGCRLEWLSGSLPDICLHDNDDVDRGEPSSVCRWSVCVITKFPKRFPNTMPTFSFTSRFIRSRNQAL